MIKNVDSANFDSFWGKIKNLANEAIIDESCCLANSFERNICDRRQKTGIS